MTQINNIDSTLSPVMPALIKDRKIYSQLLDLFRASRSASIDIIHRQLSTLPGAVLDKIVYPIDTLSGLQQLMESVKNFVFGASIFISIEDPQQDGCLGNRTAEYLCGERYNYLEPGIDENVRAERFTNEVETRMQAIVDHLDWMATLQSWMLEGTPEEKRQECCDKIIAFVNSDSAELNLDGLKLTSLPPIFTSHPSFMGLIDLSLDNNNLSSFPAEILELEALDSLSLNGNKLSDIPAEICRLQNLKWLELSVNELTSLPPEVGQLSKLDGLYLRANPLRTLPAEIGQLQALEELSLQGTKLETLPAEIGQLGALKDLQLSNVPLTSFPEQIFLLPPSCEVVFGNNFPLSVDILQQVGEAIASSGFNIDSKEEQSVQESLQRLYAIAGKAPQEFPRLLQEGGETLRSWLSRLNEMADFRNKDLQKPFVNLILKYLAFAQHDARFLQEFLQVIKEAAQTCGDKMALSVLHLGIHYRLATLDRRETKPLADFLIQTVWAVNQLELIASQKVSQLRGIQEGNEDDIDVVEIYLTYPIKLKGQLALEIDIEEMLYASDVTQEDLANAVEFIQNQRNNEEARYEFLIEQKSWLEALTLRSPEEMKRIQDERESRLENAEDAVLIHKEYQQQLIALSKRVLSRKRPRSESFEIIPSTKRASLDSV